MRLKRRSAILTSAMIAVVAAIVLPATASAKKTVWVSSAAPSAPYNNCSHPGYNSIQQAISDSTAAVEVCTGTYEEQLDIERPVTIIASQATVKVPVVSQKSVTACDAASEVGDGLEDQDLISICTPGRVNISGLTVDAIWSGEPVGPTASCAYNLYGILVGGGAELRLSESVVDGAAPAAINGCQYGVGVQVGMSYASPAQVGKARLSTDVISGYQKNGITVDGEGSSAKITEDRITGAGKTPLIAQNGIGVQLGAKATIATSVVKQNECEPPSCGPNPLTEYQAEGVYFYGAEAGSSVEGSFISENDAGVENLETAAIEPASSQVLIGSDTITKNRDEDVLLNQGWATVKGDEISDSKVGIAAIQIGEGVYAQPYGPKGTASGDTFSGLTEWAIAGDSDNAPGDKPGSISIKGSAISGNPGATVAESIHTDNEAQLPIITKHDS
jgi:hypothetical protein